MMKLIQIRGFDGAIAYASKKCTICGFEGWSDVCENERIFGKCEPQKDHRRKQRRKYRKTPRSQVNLKGQNLRDLFWRAGEFSPKKDKT